MAEYAIIQSGSQQYYVKLGDVIDVDLLASPEGRQTVEFDKVLFFSGAKGVQVGTVAPLSLRVRGEVVGQVRGPKVIAYKYKKRKNCRRKVGHRQGYTRVKIVEFVG